ncbi:MAG: hypothetical protein D3910_20790 [Candidatus Electrothrix sp. ATG2]|nr:hypothetical protein [Candidatus Electrothrix sp. ATG2]
MKSLVTISFLVTFLLTAGTAFSYDCYEKAPPQVRPCTCSKCEKTHCRQHSSTCRCRECCETCATRKQDCKKKITHRQSYQCETTYTKRTEHVTTVQCKFCGTRHPKGVDHYCNRVQCRSCGQIHPRNVEHRCGRVQCRTCNQMHPRDVEHRCGTVRCKTCGVHHPQGMRHRCGEIRSQYQDCSQGDCFQGNGCRYEAKPKQCATRNCNVSKETMETRWHAWFQNQKQGEAFL